MSRSILPEEKRHLRSVMDKIRASPKPLGPDLAADAMPCIEDACPAPTSCQHAGECSARVKDCWDSWWGAFAECRRLGIDLGPVLGPDLKRRKEET